MALLPFDFPCRREQGGFMANFFSGRSVLACLGAAAMLAAGVSPAEAQSRRSREAPRPLPSVGEPGLVVAADIAFAKSVREDGASAALGEHAATGAVVHTPFGRIPAAELAAGELAHELSPNSVWTSCDGSLAVSFGRYSLDDGTVGNYASVWELDDGRDYKWSYRLAAADDPQPVKPPSDGDIADPDNTIVVPGLDVIQGQVADCARFSDIPDLRIAMMGSSISDAGEASRDGTLYWRWSASSDGSARLRVFILRGGEWESALDFGTGRWSDVR